MVNINSLVCFKAKKGAQSFCQIPSNIARQKLNCQISGFSKYLYGVGGIRNFVGGIFLPGGENLSRSDFDNSNIFQSCVL